MTIMTKVTTAVSTLAIAGALSFGAVAQDTGHLQKLKDLNPLEKAQKQCETLRREAATGTPEQKDMAEEKCQKAIEQAKEKMAKDPQPE